eukprot:1032851-Amphidinium_carterae.1
MRERMVAEHGPVMKRRRKRSLASKDRRELRGQGRRLDGTPWGNVEAERGRKRKRERERRDGGNAAGIAADAATATDGHSSTTRREAERQHHGENVDSHRKAGRRAGSPASSACGHKRHRSTTEL